MTTCVVFDGPFADVDKYGDEFPYWVVFTGDDEGEPTGKVYTCYRYSAADELARNIARDRKLEIVMDASQS